jgi:hypothetical protein
VDNFTLLQLLSPWNNLRYPLATGIGLCIRRSDTVIADPFGNQRPAIHPVTSHFTDWNHSVYLHLEAIYKTYAKEITCNIFPVHFIPLCLITLIIFGEEIKLYSSSLCILYGKLGEINLAVGRPGRDAGGVQLNPWWGLHQSVFTPSGNRSQHFKGSGNWKSCIALEVLAAVVMKSSIS